MFKQIMGSRAPVQSEADMFVHSNIAFDIRAHIWSTGVQNMLMILSACGVIVFACLLYKIRKTNRFRDRRIMRIMGIRLNPMRLRKLVVKYN